VLYLPPSGGTIFTNRQPLRLAYQSQRSSADDRDSERSLKARKKLGMEDYHMLHMPYCPRPKWMRRHIHARLVGVIRDVHEHKVAYMMRRWGVRR